MTDKELIAEAWEAVELYDRMVTLPAPDIVEREAGRNLQYRVRRLVDALEASLGERDASVAAIERVRVRHEKEPVNTNYGGTRDICLECEQSWPCPTIRALDGAPEPEWEREYGLLVEALGDTEPEPYPTRESAQHVIDHPEMYRKWTHDNPVTMYSRRPAGPWLPVEGESK